MADLFINYRTADARFGAAAVYALLSDRFGTERVFLDHRSMEPGARYPDALRAALESVSALVVLIGPEWMAVDPDAKHRLLIDRDGDWVRREIARALERDIPIVPVLLDGTVLPDPAALPADVRDLVHRQAAEVRHRSLTEDVHRLATRLNDLVPVLSLSDLFESTQELPGDPLPSELLLPEYRVVGFRAVDDQLPRLTDWLTTEARVDVRLVTGPGGQGKTRLAAELVEHARTARWVAGFVKEDADHATFDRTARLDRPRLLVVDYAEARSAQITALVSAVAERRADVGPVRLLLLARSAGPWLDELRRNKDANISRMFRRLSIERAAAIPPGDTTRLAEFERAAEAFQRQLGIPVRGLVVGPADLDQDRYDRMLDVHAAALATVLDHAADETMPERTDPLERVLDHEERYWLAAVHGRVQHSGEGDQPLPDAHLDRLRAVVSAATLFGADDPAGARELLAGLRTFAGVGADPVERYRRWLARLYPGPAALNPLRPDRLGEDLVVATLTDDPGFAGDLASTVTDTQLTRALTVLARAVQRHDTVREHLKLLLAADLTRRIPIGMDIATQVHSPVLVAVLTELSADDDAPELAEAIVARLPSSTLALAAFAVMRTEALLHLALRDDPVDTAFVAGLRNDLSMRRSAVGDHDQALVAAGRAVAGYRTVGDERKLANALHTLAVAYANLGMHEDAASAAAESVEILEAALAARDDAGDVDAIRISLGRSLIAHGIAIGDLGLVDQAAAQIARGVALDRELADTVTAIDTIDEGVRAKFQSRLAYGLENLSATQHRRGRPEESLRAGAEAVAIFRDLDARAADMFRSDLIRALGNLAGSLADQRRSDEGMRVGAEAVSLARSLVHTYGEAHLGVLVNAVNNIAVLASHLGQHEVALGHLDESVSLCRVLAARQPGTELEMLASGLQNLANALDKTGRSADAVAVDEEAVEIYRKLAGPRPDVFEPVLAEALTDLAGLRSTLGDIDAAAELVAEAIVILEGCREQERADLRVRLAKALTLRAYTAFDLDRFRPAWQDARRATDLHRTLIEEGRRMLVPAYAEIVHLQAQAAAAAGEHEAAAGLYPAVIAVWREVIAASDPDDRPTLDYRRETLATALDEAAQYAREHGDQAGAEQLLAEAVRLRTDLLGTEPGTALDLAETLNNLADTLCDLGEHAQAVPHADEAVRIARSVATDDDDRAVATAVYTLATRARAVSGGNGGDNIDAAVDALGQAWQLAHAAADDDLVEVVRDGLRDLDAPAELIARKWAAVTGRPCPTVET